MSSTNIFTIRKSSDESIAYGVRFLKKELEQPPYVVLSAEIVVLDESGADVTSTLLNSGYTNIAGDTVNFMVQAGVSEQVYQIRVKATMSDNETKPVAWGLIVVVDPILGT